MSKKYHQTLTDTTNDSYETDDVLWKSPNGAIVGVFIGSRFFTVAETAVEYLTSKGIPNPKEHLKSMSCFPIGSSKLIMDRLNKYRNDKITVQNMGSLINSASDWFGDIPHEIA